MLLNKYITKCKVSQRLLQRYFYKKIFFCYNFTSNKIYVDFLYNHKIKSEVNKLT